MPGLCNKNRCSFKECSGEVAVNNKAGSKNPQVCPINPIMALRVYRSKGRGSRGDNGVKKITCHKIPRASNFVTIGTSA